MEIATKAQVFVENLFKNQNSEKLVYHTYSYTESVVKAAENLVAHLDLAKEESKVVLISAWFHTSGFISDYENEVEKSQEIAESFLKSENAPDSLIQQVKKALLSLKQGHEPETETEAILHDAILSPLSKKSYFKASQNLRKEKADIQETHYTDLEWYQAQLKYVIANNYITEYGKKVLEPGKEKVVKDIKKKMKKHQADLDISMEKELGVSPAELKELKKKLAKVEGRPERGIETMFRLTSKNHLTLSGMADTKANIMISVNSIILSILIGSLMQKLDNNPQLTIPTYVMLFVNLGAIIFSILSTRPNITSGKFTRADIENHKTNLLFFGNFHKMQRPDYQWGMERLMENGKYLYSSLIDDIFFLGVVLGKKYRYLRIAYNIFMYGIVLAVITFMISNMVYGDV